MAHGLLVSAGALCVNCSKTRDERLADVSLTPPRYLACLMSRRLLKRATTNGRHAVMRGIRNQSPTAVICSSSLNPVLSCTCLYVRVSATQKCLCHATTATKQAPLLHDDVFYFHFRHQNIAQYIMCICTQVCVILQDSKKQTTLSDIPL